MNTFRKPGKSHIEWQITVAMIVAVESELLQTRSVLKEAAVAVSPDERVFFLESQTSLIRIVLVKTPHPSQGSEAAGWAAAQLAIREKPDFILMVGLCAGNDEIPKNKTAPWVEFKDVVVAVRSLRHDSGKLENSNSTDQCQYMAKEYAFNMRAETIETPDVLVTALLSYLDDFRPSEYKIVPGILATGNQVITLPGFFGHLQRQISHKGGDECMRRLVGLEMEAYSVAYAAKKCDIPWLVIKGVADRADENKSDDHQMDSVRNAAQVSVSILKYVVAPLLPSLENRRRAEHLEKESQKKFEKGDVMGSAEDAEIAHGLGRRTPSMRKNYVHGLSHFARYAEMDRVLDEYCSTAALDDEMTLELQVTLALRRGDHEKIDSLIKDRDIEGNRQLLYLNAAHIILAHSGEATAVNRSVTDLEKALAFHTLPDPWWIHVNLYWAMRLQKRLDARLEEVFEKAFSSLQEAISRSARPAPRLYLLMLLALAKNKPLFEKNLERIMQEARHIQVNLDLVDLVLERLTLMMAKEPDSQSQYNNYWMGISRFVKKSRQMGNFVRPTTQSRLA